MSHYYQLESERIQFRKLSEDDIPLWEPFFINNDRLKFLGIPLDLSSLESATNWIEMAQTRYAPSGLGQLAAIDKSSGEFLGVAGVIPREMEGRNEFEITYSFLPEFWGRGYATESAICFKNYMFNNTSVDRVISMIEVNNTDSQKVAIKNGMRPLFKSEFRGMRIDVFGVERG